MRQPGAVQADLVQENRHRRSRLAEAIAADHGGVAHRAALRAAGIDRHEVRTEIRAGRWSSMGRHTVVLAPSWVATDRGRWWWAIWESGSGAALDGVTALLAGGLSGWRESSLHVNVPPPNVCYRHTDVRVHRRRVMGPTLGAGPPRCRPESATIRAAQWAVSERQAALIVAMSVQQRLVHPTRLLDTWFQVGRSPRRALIDRVIRDVCDGAQSLGELDFARLCRRHRLPEPRRQSVRQGPAGRFYLDAEFDGGLVVEIDGGHHLLGLAPVDDALRANEITLAGSRVLRIPLLGLRLTPEAFMAQVARALALDPADPAMHNASDMPRSA